MAEEAFHNIKYINQKSMVLKLYLIKSYDHVDWGFLRLILLHNGVSLEATVWVMACVVSANYTILVNGSPTYLLRGTRGVR